MIVIRNLNTIIIAGTLIISVLAFFGYNKIENIEKIVIDKTNQRLAITDSLLAKIDQKKIDSIKNILIVKEKEYSTIITNFEKTIQQNRELELLFLKSIPENESIKENNVSYSLGNPEGLFEVVINNKKLKSGQKDFVYLIFQEDLDLGPDDFISIKLYPKDRGILMFHKDYKINSKLNKVSFVLEPFEKYKIYNLTVSYYKKEGKFYKNYNTNNEIELK